MSDIGDSKAVARCQNHHWADHKRYPESHRGLGGALSMHCDPWKQDESTWSRRRNTKEEGYTLPSFRTSQFVHAFRDCNVDFLAPIRPGIGPLPTIQHGLAIMHHATTFGDGLSPARPIWDSVRPRSSCSPVCAGGAPGPTSRLGRISSCRVELRMGKKIRAWIGSTAPTKKIENIVSLLSTWKELRWKPCKEALSQKLI